MPSVCDNKTKTADDVQQDNNIRDEAVKDFEQKVYVDKTKMQKLNEYLEKKFGSDYIKSDEFNTALKDVFGTKDNRTKLAVKINAIAQGNRIYWDYIQEYIYLNLPEGF